MPKRPKSAAGLPLTPWMSAFSVPARPGVYLRQSPAGRFACWGGRQWYADADSPAAASSRVGPSRHQTVPWRGVALPTPAPCAVCRGHTVIDRGIDPETGADLIDECPEC